MKFTLTWLRDHLDTDASLGEIVDKLTMIGLEVEGVDDPAKVFGGFRIARVVEATQHPNADRLRVRAVDPGDGSRIQVICGAPNARAGLVGVFAPPGTHIPGTGVDLEVGTIRGVESRGMMLSERELGISDEHGGIIELAADAPIGATYASFAGLDDPVVDVAITPNRADCLGVRGIARDLAAAGLGRLKPLRIPAIGGVGPCPVGVTLSFPDGPSLCPAFALRQVSGVRNGPSPAWLRKKLTSIGLRPINALVDSTNYLTHDLNRPLHVFDAAKVKGDLVVRRARHGEELLALDGRTYRLDPSMCVIADEAGVESLAGIMGGEHSGSSEGTVDVLIESALWDPLNIARTGRTLGINSDARYRFERGVDPAFAIEGLERATELVLQLCGGTPSEILLAGSVPTGRRTVEFPVSEVLRLSGLDVPPPRMIEALSALGFEVANPDKSIWRVLVPSWRGDIEGKADLVEEIVRIVGIDRVRPVAMTRPDAVARPILTPMQTRSRIARRALAGRGLVEAITWSFLPATHAAAFGGGGDALRLANPIASDLSDMRPSLVPGLVRAAQANADRGFPDAALFEVGQVFRGTAPSDQKLAATGLRRNTARFAGSGRDWRGGSGTVDAFDAKADALALLAEIGGPVDRIQITRDAPDWLHPGRSGTLRLGPNVLGAFGELHPDALEALDAEGPVVVFELILDAVPFPKARPTRAKPPLDKSDLMPVRRDFAFVVHEDVAAGDILRAARGADKALVVDARVFDVYRGDRVGPSEKSVAIEIVLQPRTRTLTDKEIDAVAERVVGAVAKATGGQLRA